MIAVPDRRRAQDHHAGRLVDRQSVQLRHPDRRHAVHLGPGVARRQGQPADRRRRDHADEHDLRQRRGAAEGRRLQRWRDVVANRVYLTDVRDVRRDEQGVRAELPEESAGARDGDRRPARTDLQGRDHDDGGARARRKSITTPAADGTPGKPSATLSSAIKVGKRLYVSGLLGNNADNKGNVEAQTKETMARIERTLKAGGLRMDRPRRRRRLHHRRRQLPGDEQRLSPGDRARTSPPARRSRPVSSARKASSRSCSSRRSNQVYGLTGYGCGACKGRSAS